MTDFQDEVEARIKENGVNEQLQKDAFAFLTSSTLAQYSYNFSWMSRPIIQYPQDILAMQELVWEVRPNLIIEAGIAHGGSLILSASLLAMLDYCDAVAAGIQLDPAKSARKVLGVDIDIRAHNRIAIEAHPLSHLIDMIEGSSILPNIISKVHEYAKKYQRIMIVLDSNHTHDHVLGELNAYAQLTSIGSYCVVFDTVVEDLPAEAIANGRPWKKGNNPKTAVWEFMSRLESENKFSIDGQKLNFIIDKSMENKLVLSVATDGFLKRV